jgi:phenylacetate-coenzyme A ligase PaaK-like adenylate-forming protein
MESELIHKMFTVTPRNFEYYALQVFRFQYENNTTYREYSEALKIRIEDVDSLESIPFLPIRFFKSHEIKTSEFTPEAIFESSGTTGTSTSRHLVKEIDLYRKSFLTSFNTFYGDPSDWCIIGLLPSYLERGNSSLVVMVNDLIQLSAHAHSGFYLSDYTKLNALLNEMEKQNQKTLLIGVTFALLDFAERYPVSLQNTTVMETGGMKGRRAELTREEVHDVLQRQLHVPEVHSEYGMTELLSQAWSKGRGRFQCPGWMKIVIRDEDDPLLIRNTSEFSKSGVSGLLNVIDLANIYSCSFIATDDIGKCYEDGSFEVLGRTDNSDMRGCSMMVV